MTVTGPKIPTEEPSRPQPIVTRPWPVRQAARGSALGRLLRTTDAKQIGIMYLVTAFSLFLIAGLMARDNAKPTATLGQMRDSKRPLDKFAAVFVSIVR